MKKLKLVTVHIPEAMYKQIELLIKLGRYQSQSELVRHAIRKLLHDELWPELEKK